MTNINKILKIADILLIEFAVVYLIAWAFSSHPLMVISTYSMATIAMIAVVLVFGFDEGDIPNKETEETIREAKKSKRFKNLDNLFPHY